jgi:hypothetical protein
METVRWNVAVSPEVDQSVRMFIAAQGGGRKGDLSRFIEDAVRAYLFGRAVEQAKAATANMAESELNDLIDEAVQWAREPLPDHFDISDKNDEFLLALALTAEADYLVTGDRRAGLLQRGSVGRTRIITPAVFCELHC